MKSGLKPEVTKPTGRLNRAKLTVDATNCANKFRFRGKGGKALFELLCIL